MGYTLGQADHAFLCFLVNASDSDIGLCWFSFRVIRSSTFLSWLAPLSTTMGSQRLQTTVWLLGTAWSPSCPETASLGFSVDIHNAPCLCLSLPLILPPLPPPISSLPRTRIHYTRLYKSGVVLFVFSVTLLSSWGNLFGSGRRKTWNIPCVPIYLGHRNYNTKHLHTHKCMHRYTHTHTHRVYTLPYSPYGYPWPCT